MLPARPGYPVDITLCTAGSMERPELEPVNGIEKPFSVNHLGHFVLIKQLWNEILAAMIAVREAHGWSEA